MIRRWAVVLAAGAAVLALAVPAQAKGEASKVSITNAGGPGGSGSGGPVGSGKSSGGSGTGSAAVLASPIVLSGPAAGSETSPGTAPWILPVALGAAAIMIVARANVAIRRRRRETARPA